MHIVVDISGPHTDEALNHLQRSDSGLELSPPEPYRSLRKPLHSDHDGIYQLAGIVVNLAQLVATLYALKSSRSAIVLRNVRGEVKLLGDESTEELHEKLATLASSSEEKPQK
jgi:hypothetical protein